MDSKTQEALGDFIDDVKLNKLITSLKPHEDFNKLLETLKSCVQNESYAPGKIDALADWLVLILAFMFLQNNLSHEKLLDKISSIQHNQMTN